MLVGTPAKYLSTYVDEYLILDGKVITVKIILPRSYRLLKPSEIFSVPSNAWIQSIVKFGSHKTK